MSLALPGTRKPLSSGTLPELLLKVSYEDGGRFEARIPDSPILPIFTPLGDLLRSSDCTIRLGLDIPMIDIHLHVYPNRRVAADILVDPVSLGSIQVGPSGGLKSLAPKIEEIQKTLGAAPRNRDEPTEQAEVELGKFLSSISTKSLPGVMGGLDFTLTAQNFWMTTRELITAVKGFADEITPLVRDVQVPTRTVAEEIAGLVSRLEAHPQLIEDENIETEGDS